MDEYLQFTILVVSVVFAYTFLYFVVHPLAKLIASKTPNKFDDLLVNKGVITRGLMFVPVMVFVNAFPQIIAKGSFVYEVCEHVGNILFTVVAFFLASAVLDVIENLNERNARMRVRPLHGIFQAVKLVMFCVATILVASQVINKSPVIILSALGAMATVLILVFRDSILGLVAGIQINLSDLLRKGDWIEIERHHADGSVIDITLTSVKVRNWDNTVSVIPAYDLITNSFRNWRWMQESGGRRIKRSLYIDQQSIRFLTDGEIETLMKIDILRPYLEQKINEIGKYSGVTENDTITRLNGRHLTNIGTFRAFCTAYLRSRNTIAQDMTLMTRQLAPTPMGLPLEIYAFANTVKWEDYENVQSDIFDFLIAALPEFGLSLYEYAGRIP
jgi:miniconductance mechanosensitive channel